MHDCEVLSLQLSPLIMQSPPDLRLARYSCEVRGKLHWKHYTLPELENVMQLELFDNSLCRLLLFPRQIARIKTQLTMFSCPVELTMCLLLSEHPFTIPNLIYYIRNKDHVYLVWLDGYLCPHWTINKSQDNVWQKKYIYYPFNTELTHWIPTRTTPNFTYGSMHTLHSSVSRWKFRDYLTLKDCFIGQRSLITLVIFLPIFIVKALIWKQQSFTEVSMTSSFLSSGIMLIWVIDTYVISKNIQYLYILG